MEAEHVRPASAGWASAFALIGVVLAVTAVAAGWARGAPPVGALAAVQTLETGAFLAFVLLGSIIVLRRPGHPVGWLLAALGLAVLLQQSAQQYALQGSGGQPTLPAWPVASWVAEWSIAPPLVLFVEVLLLFPSGRPRSPTRRVFVWAVAVAGVLLTGGWAAATWPHRGAALMTGVGMLPDALEALRLVLIACVPAAVVTLIWRFRRAGRDEQQQLKWLLLAGCGLAVAAAAGLIVAAMGTTAPLVDAFGVVSIAGVAVAIALAILRYRLYEIDHILSRTVSYALLTALLAATYTVSVVAVGAALRPLSADSSVDVAASTLLVAATFSPLRTRVRQAVDRRFNRSRYDAAQSLAAFRARVRDDVRLESVQTELLTTVAGTVQPATAGVWLRPAPTAQRRRAGAVAQSQSGSRPEDETAGNEGHRS